MTIEDYLAQGGVLTSPANVPPRYRAELMKLMASFVDSELAGAAGFADIINQGPGIKERIAAARIVLEKTDHADKVLAIMGDFGADTARYANHHPWAARLDRDADIGARRGEHDMRLAVFNYPLAGWGDAVVMNLLMGRAVVVQLGDMQMVSYQPLAEAFRAIAPVELRHAELAEEGLARLIVRRAGRGAASLRRLLVAARRGKLRAGQCRPVRPAARHGAAPCRARRAFVALAGGGRGGAVAGRSFGALTRIRRRRAASPPRSRAAPGGVFVGRMRRQPLRRVLWQGHELDKPPRLQPPRARRSGTRAMPEPASAMSSARALSRTLIASNVMSGACAPNQARHGRPASSINV